MKRAALVSTTLLLLCVFAQAQTAMPDDGLVKDGVYFNRYFGFGFTYPKDWVVHDQATNDRIHERAREEAAKTGTLAQAKVTYPLLSVTRHPQGAPGISVNPVVFAIPPLLLASPSAPEAEMAQIMNTILPLGRGGNIPLATPAPRQ